ncbi:MAG TPA: hypothetical protein VGN88_00085 [Phycisphaerae bacterium]
MPVLVALLAIGIGVVVFLVGEARKPEVVTIPSFSTALGTVHKAMPLRMVSFHRGRADKNLIKLAAQLGFNGVQFQIEGSNCGGVLDFAARDAREHLIDYCHSLGMQVTVWVHELSDLPPYDSDDYLGDVSIDNQKLWSALEERYEWMIGKVIPKVDGLVLTVVETQYKISKDTPMQIKLVNMLDRICKEHGKYLIARTFVWEPAELDSVMATVQQMPKDVVVMSKAVPQDWQMRGGNAKEIGAVGEHQQIVEFDALGEYFLHNCVANCMVDLLKQQFDYAASKNAQGICVRVDRYDDNLLFEPSEVNLWTLGLLAAGSTDSTDEIWRRWATAHYGEKAAPGVIEALKPTSQVVAEMLSIGPFTFADTRYYPYDSGSATASYLLPDGNLLSYNWEMWKWDDSYYPTYLKARAGEASFTREIAGQKAAALKLADECLAKLEKVKGELNATEYEILHARLLSNKVQLQYRAPMAMAALHIRQYVDTLGRRDAASAAIALNSYNADLLELNRVADDIAAAGEPQKLHYHGKDWKIGAPDIGPVISDSGVLKEWAELAKERPNVQR